MCTPLFDKSKAVGTFGENWLYEVWGDAGLPVYWPKRFFAGDLRLGGLKIEVKTSRINKDGTHQFSLYRALGKRVVTDAKHADYVILLCLTKANRVGQILVIPVSELAAGQKQIKITNPAIGKYAKYICNNIVAWGNNVLQ